MANYWKDNPPPPKAPDTNPGSIIIREGDGNVGLAILIAGNTILLVVMVAVLVLN